MLALRKRNEIDFRAREIPIRRDEREAGNARGKNEGGRVVDVGGERLVDGARRRGLPLQSDPAGQVRRGSMSTSNTRWSARASDAARLMAVVVFPTPPF